MSIKHKWSQDELSYFVGLYKYHECLWNTRDRYYDNEPLRDEAFADIAAKMLQHKNIDGLGVFEIKNKISNLRTTYYQLEKKYRYSSIKPSERAGQWYNDLDYMIKNSKWSYRKKLTELNAKLFANQKTLEPQASTSYSTMSKLNQNYEEDVEWKIEQTVKESSTDLRLVKLQSRIEIMNVLKKLYIEKVAPTYHIVLDILIQIIRNDDKYLTSSVEGFRHEMNKLGYIYKETIDGKKIIVENAEQRYERYLYLTKIRKIRAKQNKPIVYIDERIINLEMKYDKIYNSKGDLPPDSSLLFIALSKEGVVSCLICNQANEEDFYKWVTDILLGLLKDPCVIVMDNGPIHGKKEDTCSITRYSTKIEMLKWLIDNNIPNSPRFSRPELFELIKMNKRDTKEYKIDRIIKSHGHEVLRLPQNIPELNMSDVLWNLISDGHTAKILNQTVSQTSLPILQNTITKNILPSISKKKWGELEKILIMKEGDIYQIDVAIEDILETYIFM